MRRFGDKGFYAKSIARIRLFARRDRRRQSMIVFL